MSTTTTLATAGTFLDRAAASGQHRRSNWARYRNTTLVSGTVLFLMLALVILFYPMISPWSATEPDFTQPTFAPSSWDHPLGTDNFGRDVLTRMAEAGRIDLLIALLATSVTLVVGAALGLITGFFGGWFDTLIMRLVDFTLAIPTLILVIAIVAVLGIGTSNIIFAIWLVGWVTYTRVVRSETMVARELEYVEAARVIGLSNSRIMTRHILPNVIVSAVVFAMADVVLNILLCSSLSFLGLGVQSPTPEWGLMVAEARDFFLKDWRLMTYPGIAVLIFGVAFSLIGDGLAQALRPRG